MSSLFNFITKKPDVAPVEEKKKENVFYYLKGIYKIIDNQTEDTKSALDILFADMDESEYYFLSWALNHYLFYNSFCRKNIEMFVTVNYWIRAKEYIYFYTKYMADNKVKFPRFMFWYKLNIDNGDKKYNDILKNEYDLSDDDIQSVTEYMKDRMSLREMCINLKYSEI